MFDGARETELASLLANTRPNRDGDKLIGGQGAGVRTAAPANRSRPDRVLRLDDDGFRAAEELGIDLSRPERYSDECSIGTGT